jgi:hypothetical protein
MGVSAVRAKEIPEALLRSFTAKLDPKDQKLFRAVRAALRKRLPAANEMVYDYPGNLVVSYTMTNLGKDGIVSTATRSDDVRLYFGQGKHLPDPKKLLQGSAGVRFIGLESANQLKHRDVEALIAAAIERAGGPSPTRGRGQLVIQKGGTRKR